MAKKASSSGGALPFFVGFVVMLVLGWWAFPQVLFSKAEQPIRFSHVVHVEDGGMACEDCHYLNEDGSYAGIPTTEACAECHADVMGEDPAEAEFVEKYVNEEKEVPWLIYQDQPDNVFFSHAAHQDQECTTCHPNVGESDTPPSHYRNILTGYSNGGYKIVFGRGVGVDPAYSRGTMKMWECERCHAENGQSNACYVCHR